MLFTDNVVTVLKYTTAILGFAAFITLALVVGPAREEQREEQRLNLARLVAAVEVQAARCECLDSTTIIADQCVE